MELHLSVPGMGIGAATGSVGGFTACLTYRADKQGRVIDTVTQSDSGGLETGEKIAERLEGSVEPVEYGR